MNCGRRWPVAHVFDRFWRADASRKDASLHVGLGLALVRRLVDSLGGTVSAVAADGEFRVRIHLPPTEATADVE